MLPGAEFHKSGIKKKKGYPNLVFLAFEKFTLLTFNRRFNSRVFPNLQSNLFKRKNRTVFILYDHIQ
jgi:hypothetical protein